MITSWSDVIVVGGGPAGAATAIRARAYGLSVLVLEAARFPRHHVGESLVKLWPLFDRLGVTEVMDATFQHKRGSCRLWGLEPRLRWTDFQGTAESRDYSLQVERSLFDDILLRRAASVGADVRQEHKVERVLWEGGRAVGVVARDRGDGRYEARAQWIVDASGRTGLLSRSLELRAADPFYPDLSIYGYFSDARRFPGEHDGNLLIEAIPWGWLWFIPLHTGSVSVGLVCDQSSRAELRRLKLLQYFRAAISQSKHVSRMLDGATLSVGPLATPSHGYASSQYAGAGWMLAGDAAAFVDPMWATGVARALGDGIRAAAVVDAVARGTPESEAAAWYEAELVDRAQFDLGLVKFVYGANRLHEEHPFWQARRPGSTDISSVDRIMRRLARDSSVRYFRDAFGGMGVGEATLAPMTTRLERLDGGRASALPDLETWVPVLRSSVRVRPSLGFDSDDRLVEGLIVDDDGATEFASDPLGVGFLEGIDGRRPAGEIVDAIASNAPQDRRLRARFQLLATLSHAWSLGLFEPAVADGVGATR